MRQTEMARQLFTFIIFLTGAVTGLQLIIQPQQIEEGVTQTLDINCSTSLGAGSDFVTLVSLVLSLATISGGQFNDLASVDSFSGQVVNLGHGNLTVFGNIDNNGESFLGARWSSPGLQETGVYKCTANGLDVTGQPVNVSTSSQVNVKQSEIQALKAELSKMKADIELALNNSCISGCWQNKLDVMMELMFTSSTVRNGHRYLLSTKDNRVTAPVAAATCVFFGGYLAEIDDVDEFLFVQSFVNSSDFQMTLIAGTNDSPNGTWVIQRTNQPMPFTKWGLGQPIGSSGVNCAYLNSHYNWDMDVYSCYNLETAYNFWPRFVCELPE
ncbi:unnamed protein product [Lymnaea stagnalis]|uniref:C-type lectin domain-containing protein n=1 Tax=Lymnaea stagnalis TaxID=6523 RepID=A0AAV2IH65_LYMST